MKKMILAILLLLCFALIAVSCTPNKDLPLKTDENGNVVTNEKGDPVTENKDKNENNGGGYEPGPDDEEGFGDLELVPR